MKPEGSSYESETIYDKQICLKFTAWLPWREKNLSIFFFTTVGVKAGMVCHQQGYLILSYLGLCTFCPVTIEPCVARRIIYLLIEQGSLFRSMFSYHVSGAFYSIGL